MDADAPRVAIRTLGCKVNRAESDAVAEELSAAGLELADEAEADVIVINSCTVTGEADAKTRKEVRRALAAPGEPVVVVTGCMAALEAAGLESLGDRVVVEADKDAVCGRILSVAGGGRRTGTGASAGPLADRPAGRRTRVAVKVQDGCDDRCAYCIVPDARGRPRSVPAGRLTGQVAALVAGGTAEIVLTGVNIGRYRDGGADLAALVERLAGTGVPRVRISSIEPVDLTSRLLETLAATPAVMPHLHVPLQSGCDRTLAAMGRPYDTAAFSDAVARARDALPGLAVTTDVIVGFPGESDEDFAASLAFVERAGFSRLHVFRYSRRPSTPAAAMPSQVEPRVSAERARLMGALGSRLASGYARSRVGGDANVLVERLDAGAAIGTSEDYLRVHVRWTGGLDAPGAPAEGDVLSVRFTAAERGVVWGSLRSRHADEVMGK